MAAQARVEIRVITPIFASVRLLPLGKIPSRENIAIIFYLQKANQTEIEVYAQPLEEAMQGRTLYFGRR